MHAAGGLMYYDGANANALMGNSAPGRHGLRPDAPQPAQDVLDPARRRRRGRTARSASPRTSFDVFADAGRARRDADDDPSGAGHRRLTFSLDFDRPESIGTMRSFWSNFAHMVRALAYCYANGAEGLTRVSQLAVLNANYIRASDRATFSTCRTTRSTATSSSLRRSRSSARPACARSTSPRRCSIAATTRRRCTSRCSSPSA